MKNAALTLTTLLALTASTPAYAGDDGSLEQARDLFDRVDRNDDDRISALEAGRNGIPSKDFVAYDADRDRKLSKSEFTLFYRQLIIRAGKDVDEDLAAEAARITAARRAKKDQDAERAEDARQKALEDAKRAEAARQAKQVEDAARAEKAREDAKRTEEARKDQGGESSPPADPPEAVDPPSGPTDAERAEAARAEQAAQDAARAEKARQDALRAEQARQEAARLEQARLDAERAEAARQAKLAEDAKRAEAAREEARRAEAARKGVQPKQGATPEQRAAGYVRRLVDGGRLTQAQAKDFHAVLTADGPAANPTALRGSLVSAKKRISNLVVAGSLSSDEGRELSAALDARAKAALPVETPGPAGRRVGSGPRTTDPAARKSGDDGPAATRRGDGQQGRDKSGAGSRKATDKKDEGTKKPVRRTSGGNLGGRDGR